jgi:DNA repair exonuclease SbcCD ATPase subunit
MMIRGVRIEAWRSIRRLELDDLGPGIIVLHGPNRTGKSSFVKALRGCLFDFEHNSAKAELLRNFPWDGSGPPRVAVDFEISGQRYRLNKVFSKKSDGLTRLEIQVGGQWRVEQDAPKEASRRARELLGTDKSTGGLNQLLWLDQGEVGLPRPDALDGDLEKRLVGVLGMLVTGRDLAFKQLLDERCGQWFTPRTGKYKEGSRVRHWESARAERAHLLEEAEACFRQVEQTMRDLQEGERRLPELRRALEEAVHEEEQRRQERERVQVRQQQYRQALADYRAADQQRRDAQKRLDTFLGAKERWQRAEEEAVRAEAAARIAREEREARLHDHETKVQAVGAAREEEEAHQAGQQEIQDRRTFVNLVVQRCQQEQTLQKARQHQDDIAGLEQLIHGLTAPDEPTITRLRENRREATVLRAQLQAETLAVAVTLHRPGSVQVSRDCEPAQSIDLAAGARQDWMIRQQAGIEVPDVGRVEVRRGRVNQDLERVARRLDELDQAYRDTVLSVQERPEDEACLDRLTERRLEREAAFRKLKALRAEQDQVAPLGLAALEADLAKLDGRRRLVIERRPGLAGWEPNEDDVTALERSFQKRVVELQKATRAREAAEKQAAATMKGAETSEQESHGKWVEARTTAKNARQELQRLGDELALTKALELAERVVAAAQQHLARSELTEAEAAVEQRCAEAENARRLREERVREQEGELQRLRGFLQSAEGLHTRRADAAASLREADEALERERVEAEAHKLLQELFEQSRDNQVQQVMGPIAGRVVQWAHDLGLDEYGEVRFGDRFLPECLLRRAGAAEMPVALSDESYGTAEQLGLLVRLALGGVLARDEPVVAILDDPLAHADPAKHRRLLDVLRVAAEGNVAWHPPAGRLQVFILTCHPDRFDYLPGARHIDLARAMSG